MLGMTGEVEGFPSPIPISGLEFPQFTNNQVRPGNVCLGGATPASLSPPARLPPMRSLSSPAVACRTSPAGAEPRAAASPTAGRTFDTPSPRFGVGQVLPADPFFA